jgi:isopenicillin N synthase-like dioxygenase
MLLSPVKNHGIPAAVIENTLQMAREFFSLTDAEKMDVRALRKSYSSKNLMHWDRSRTRNLLASRVIILYSAQTMTLMEQVTCMKALNLDGNLWMGTLQKLVLVLIPVGSWRARTLGQVRFLDSERRFLNISTSPFISLKLKLKLFHSHAAVEVGKRLFPLFALALELPNDFFDEKVKL